MKTKQIITENMPVSPEPWASAHMAAFKAPWNGHEFAIVSLVRVLAAYIDAHEARFGKLSDDLYLGPAWLNIAHSTLHLLNGETGRLDCATIDRTVRALAKHAGFEEQEL